MAANLLASDWLFEISIIFLIGYYSPSFADVIQLDAAILLGLLKRVSPAAHKHLTKQEIDPTMIIQEWFLCVYSRTLPWPSVLRVWDMFMCEGVKVIFKVTIRGYFPTYFFPIINGPLC